MKYFAFLKGNTTFNLIFCLEILEKFSYYGFISIVILYAMKVLNTGQIDATQIRTLIIILLYIPIFFVGYICDKYVSSKRAIYLGMVLLTIGYVILSMLNEISFYIAIGLIIAGNSFFKIGPPKLLANSLKIKYYQIDSLFTLYYMAINIGSFLGMLFFPLIAHYLGFGFAFRCNAIIMVFASLLFLKYYSFLGEDVEPHKKSVIYIVILIVAITLASILVLLSKDFSNILFTLLLISAAYFLYIIFKQEDKLTKRRILIVGVLMVESLVFFIPHWFLPLTLRFFAANFSQDTLFNFEINPNFFQILNPLWIFLFSPIVAYIYLKLEKDDKEFHITKKIAIGTLIGSVGFLIISFSGYYNKGGHASAEWIVIAYLCVAIGELLVRGLGLAMITKLVKSKNFGFMMGIWYLLTPIAFIVSKFLPQVPGAIQHNIHTESALYYFSSQFLVLGLIGLIFGAIMLLFADKLSDLIKAPLKREMRNISKKINASLKKKIPKKMMNYFLVTGLLIAVTMLLVNYHVSNSMYNTHTNTWINYFKKNVAVSLQKKNSLDVEKIVKVLETSKLFSTFIVFNNKKMIITGFGESLIDKQVRLTKILSKHERVLGYYAYKTDYDDYFIPFLWLIVICLLAIILLYFYFGYLSQKMFKLEFNKFGALIEEIERLSRNLTSPKPLKSNLDISVTNASEEELKLNKLYSSLVEEINNSHTQLRKATSEAEKNSAKSKYAKKEAELVAQVSHDLQSPISALNTLLQNFHKIPGKERILLRNAVSRIVYISNNLPQKNINEDASIMRLALLGPVLESIASEKYYTFEKNHIDFQFKIIDGGITAFSKIHSDEMKRVISNILNNAADALRNNVSKKILMSLVSSKEGNIISIEDSGCGISSDKVNVMFDHGVSFKEKGSGLGLSHAKSNVEKWGGEITAKSRVSQGTCIRICLPKINAPLWFLSEICINKNIPVVIIDDDKSIHDAWNQKFEPIKRDIILYHFMSLNEFEKWWLTSQEAIQLFSDFELQSRSETGLDFMIRHKILGVLVTSYYENINIIEKCLKHKLKLIPKNILPYMPISFNSESKGFSETNSSKGSRNLILIDDDKNVRFMWELMAEKNDDNLLTFSSFKEFSTQIATINRNISIYIDYHLENGENGLECAEILFQKGFETIYLATGKPAETIKAKSWLKGIVDKNYPLVLRADIKKR